MNRININAKDWNLLPVFESLFRTHNVSKSAKELSLSQSAVSHALGRLRDMFGDPLFTRVPRGVVPTPKAIELAPKVSQLTAEMSALLERGAFSPKTARGRIAIASTEYLEQTVLKSMFGGVRKEAPGIVFQFRNVHGKLPKLQMERGEIDIAIAGFFGNLPEGFYQQKLFENDFVVVARQNHPVIRESWNTDTYVQLEHLLVSPQGDLWGLIDERLLQMKKSRRVVAGFENYLSPGWLVASSDLVVTVPRYLGYFYAANLKVQVLELPIPSPKITIVQAWHERTHSSPLHQFIRSEIVKSVKQYEKTAKKP